MCRPSHAVRPSRTLVLSLTFCMRVSLRTKVDLSGCCGWLWKTSFVYVFWFGWLWRFSLKDSLCSSLICGCGGKNLIWDLSTHGLKASQSTLHQWVRSTHSRLTQQLHTQTLTHRDAVSRASTHTNACTHWHTLGLSDQSEQSGVGPASSGWERCWNRSLSQDTPSFTWFGELFCLLFLYLKKEKKKNQTTLGSISTQLECGMAEMLRIRKKRLQIPISR